MDYIILALCICSFVVNMLTFIAMLAVISLILHKLDKKTEENKPKTPVAPKKEASEAEKQRILQEQQRRLEEWNNFLSYTGDVQTKKGGD